MEFPVLQFIFIASYPGHHWKEYTFFKQRVKFLKNLLTSKASALCKCLGDLHRFKLAAWQENTAEILLSQHLLMIDKNKLQNKDPCIEEVH